MSETRGRTVPSVPPSVRSGGLVAGKYRVESMLGEGGMGTVWAATHVELGQRVALKLISSELSRSPDLLARFKAEAKAAAQLQSRYVVRMYDSGVTEDGRPYIAMEFLQGESLEDRLTRVGALPLMATLRIVTQVCKALKLAHAQGIIHRDLKPANIFLATTGDEEEVAKVLDFGIAKMLDHERDHGATATGIILGTPLYMSPEQARALKTLDHRSDLYSLGMVTYRMLVGDPPFQGESFGDLVYSICTRPLPSMHAQVPSLPVELDTWFQTACAKEPTQRYSTAEQMSEALWAASGLSASHLNQIDTGGRPVPSGLAHLPVSSGNTGLGPGLVDHGARAAMTGQGSTDARSAATMLGPSASTNAGTAVPLSKPKNNGLPIALGAGTLALIGAVALGAWFMLKDPAVAGGGGPVASEVKPTPAAPAQTQPQPSAAGTSETASAPDTVSAPSASPSVTIDSAASAGAAAEAVTEDEVPDSQGKTKGRRRTVPGGSPEGEKPNTGTGKTETPDMGF